MVTVLDDFDAYERDYLERCSRGLTIKARAHIERVEAVRKAATKADLEPWDYAILYMIKREDPRIAIKAGTVRSSESILKLYCHGLIAKMDRPATFDELERLQMFLDSAEYKQYQNRLRRLMTTEVAERLKIISEITGTYNEKDMLDITDEGDHTISAKRAEIITLYEQIHTQYHNNKAEFYRDVQSYMWALPMMIVMGIGHGAILSHMHSMSDIPYTIHDGASQMDFGGVGEMDFASGYEGPLAFCGM